MNERIEQLAEQCWTHTNEPLFGAKSPHWEFDRQKFAELIVRECCDVLSNEEIRHEGYGYNQSFLHKKIKEHFGVE